MLFVGMGDTVTFKRNKTKTARQLTKKSKKHAVSFKSKTAKSKARPGRAPKIKARKPARVIQRAIRGSLKAVKAKIKAPLPKKEPEKPVKKELTEKEIAILQKEHTQKISKILGDSSVRQNLIGIGGENALSIVRSFYGNHSDDDLAKKLKIKISDVRATLNKLHNEGLVNYLREKDSETGWYSYSWTLNHARMERWASSQVTKINALTGTGVDYYFCPSCGTSSITNFESAAGTDFRCERCNRLLEFIDEKKIAELHERKI
jgi:transcription initiation factor TFIIE subunit alpha